MYQCLFRRNSSVKSEVRFLLICQIWHSRQQSFFYLFKALSQLNHELGPIHAHHAIVEDQELVHWNTAYLESFLNKSQPHDTIHRFVSLQSLYF